MLDAPNNTTTDKSYKAANIISRWVKFEYTDPSTANGNRILVSKIQRQVLKNDIPTPNASIDTGYSYDSQGRIILVTQTGMADTTYAYAAVTGGGLTVTMTQSTKSSTYEFNNLGELKKKNVKNFNPVNSSNTTLNWAYNYVRSTSDYKVTIYTPTDTVERYTYDLEGNLTKQQIGLLSELSVSEAAFSAAGSSTKETLYSYDADNRLLSETTPARAKSSLATEKVTGVGEAFDSANASYSYQYADLQCG